MLRIGSLFSGYGGLDEGVRRAIGGDVAWHSEVEPAACKVLEHHWPDVPNLGDITKVEWADVPAVDVLTGGFPCQDVSAAGKRAGLTPDSRSGLWAHMARAINVLRPQLVVIENVRGLLSADAACDLEPCPWCLGDDEGRPLRALGAVLGDLAVLGYDARWHGLRAADAGAPHGRFRVFITAWPTADPSGGELQRRRVGGVLDGAAGSGEGEGPQRQRDRDTVGDGGAVVADASHLGHERGGRARDGWTGPADSGVAAADPQGVGWGEGRPEPAGLVGGPDAALGGTYAAGDSDGVDSEGRGPAGLEREAGPAAGPMSWPVAADPDSAGPQGRGLGRAGGSAAVGGSGSATEWGDYTPAIRRWERALGRPAPAPTQTGARGGQQLSPRFVEWLQGLTPGWVTDVPGLSRNEMLKLLGNGVVPQQAELALRHLLGGEVSERAA